MTRDLTRTKFLSALAGLGLLAGCGNDATAPRFQPEVTNLANSFGFQVTGLDGVTDNVEYTWRNDGTVANVNQSPSGLSGTVSLIILDAAGTQVYSRSLTDNGTFVTTAGTAGNWKVRVQFSAARGSVNFTLQRP